MGSSVKFCNEDRAQRRFHSKLLKSDDGRSPGPPVLVCYFSLSSPCFEPVFVNAKQLSVVVTFGFS